MNTGLQDVWNLVWKLDLVVRGHGSQQLLDSYSAERRPVINRVLDITDLLTKAMGTPSKLAQAIRDASIPMVSRMPSFQRRFVQNLSQLGITYRGSPIVEGAGRRYLDDSLRGGKGIASRFLLFLGADSDSSDKEAAEGLCRSLNDVVEVRLASRPGVVLVRPDGYIAYSAYGSDQTSALRAVRLLVERQTK